MGSSNSVDRFRFLVMVTRVVAESGCCSFNLRRRARGVETKLAVARKCKVARSNLPLCKGDGGFPFQPYRCSGQSSAGLSHLLRSLARTMFKPYEVGWK